MTPDLIPHLPLFDSVPRRRRSTVAGLADVVEIPAGKTITREGELAREFFVIADGVAEVTRGGTTVALVGPGDVVGEIGLLAGSARTATVRAATPMRVVVFASREFHTLCAAFPKVRERIEEAMVARAA